MTDAAEQAKTDILLVVVNGVDDDILTFQGEYLPERLEKELSTVTGVAGLFFSLPESYQGVLARRKNSLRRDDTEDATFWKETFAETGSDHIIRIFADTPFLDLSIISEMIALHLEYLAEFTYSDNLPEGFSCEIIAKDLVENIPGMKEKSLPLTQVIRSNINQFDVELYYKGPDIRDKRLSFRSSHPRDRRIMENLFDIHGSRPPYEEIKALIEKNPGSLYIAPSYLEIELTGRCDLDCIFCYRKSLPAERGDMDLSLFDKIVTEMDTFALPYTICFGGSGEPLMHRDFLAFARRAAESPLAERIIIETAGHYLSDEIIEFLRNEKNEKFHLIINCNGCDEETWRQIHGANHFQRVSKTIDALSSLTEAEGKEPRLHLQIMKINETEKWLDRYYDHWEEKKVPVILQKQNTFLGRIEDRRYSDLSPLERTPCWHLQRDCVILSDGTVAFCKQDVTGEKARGSLKETTLTELFEKGRDDFLANYRGEYPPQPDCRNCDEWYTFNF